MRETARKDQQQGIRAVSNFLMSLLCAAAVCVYGGLFLAASLLGAIGGNSLMGGSFGAVLGSAFATSSIVALFGRFLAGNTCFEAVCSAVSTAIMVSILAAIFDRAGEIDRLASWIGCMI